jgi:N-glycosylase/DNA lyase
MQDILSVYNQRKGEIGQRLNEFKKKSKEGVFDELCFCLLTPQSNAQRCWSSIIKLKKENVLKNGQVKEMIKHMNGCRFHKTKARRIIEIREKFDEIYEKIQQSEDGKELREWLVKNVNGYGYKEASHFMRNIGFTNISILDRHILRCLKEYGAINEIPKTMTKKKYMEIEKIYFDFSRNVGIAPSELDLLFWSMKTGFIFK